MTNEVSVFSIFCGSIGFMFVFGPSWDTWYSFLKQMFKN